MRRLVFDLDCMLNKELEPVQQPGAPLYICGVARAGTTVLLEALYASGAFATLTYRNMPFVMAPLLWSRFISRHRIEATPGERAHGDALLVDYDSPEAFEEVFWGTVTESDYVQPGALVVHSVDEESLVEYRRYVSNVVAAHGQPYRRYLAKNNNNLLRLDSIRKAFADAIILVPFRHPGAQASSLLRQHRRFLDTHAKDVFGLEYMNWLGHFEFGANMKPFQMPATRAAAANADTVTHAYWVDYWSSVYAYVLREHGGDVLFFDYDRLCADPTGTLGRLAEVIGLRPAQLVSFAPRIRATRRADNRSAMAAVPSDVARLHQALRERAL